MTFNVSGGKGDDFPNEFRNVIQIVGPVEVTISDGAIGKVVPYSARYSVTYYGVSELLIESIGNCVYKIYDAEYGTLEEFRFFDKKWSVLYRVP